MSKRFAPRKQRFTSGNGAHAEPVTLENCVLNSAWDAFEYDDSACLKLPNRNRDIIVRRREPANSGKKQGNGHPRNGIPLLT